ncbi:U2 small nuclear ribonucleoprotein A' [Thoreauomyces humboldtii]|nr:U2 small nuclear ribonucleoprotein A' [Thoreauomyces humboldtii]
MVKLNYDVLVNAHSFINAIKDRELDLRGLKIPLIENLSITKDGNDVIDFTDNDIRRLEGFPTMPRLKSLLLANNRISRIDVELAKQLPNLVALILSNNLIEDTGDLDPLGAFENLVWLSLTDNPVATRKHYRHYVIHRCPKVRILDFRKVKEKERQEAAALFSGPDGIALAASLSSKHAGNKNAGSNTFEPGEALKRASKPFQGPSPEEAAKIRAAIAAATTLDEVTRLEKLLTGGVVPDVVGGKVVKAKKTDRMEVDGQVEEEEEEDEQR